MVVSENVVIKDTQLTVKINPKVYPLEAVYSAAYVFMDKAYIVLDGDPANEILVKMRLKKEGSLEELGNEFNNELLNYSDYLTRAKETKKIREMFLQRAIVTNDPTAVDSEFDDIELDEDFEDPEGIAVPWEEKYGREQKQEDSEQNEDKPQQ